MTGWTDKQIGKYQVKEFLGRGGMGEVYRAVHPNLERDVAIKMIHSLAASTPRVVDRFQREAKVVATLRHPGIVQVYDFDVEASTLYMVMEYIPGKNLQQHLNTLRSQGTWLSLAEALRMFQLITEAVAYAHGHGVIHRDLKPANVLLLANQQPILADFGLSKIISDEPLTYSGQFFGTPNIWHLNRPPVAKMMPR